jgi:hypothetical protein
MYRDDLDVEIQNETLSCGNNKITIWVGATRITIKTGESPCLTSIEKCCLSFTALPELTDHFVDSYDKKHISAFGVYNILFRMKNDNLKLMFFAFRREDFQSAYEKMLDVVTPIIALSRP